jgi:subtilase family serine protease
MTALTGPAALAHQGPAPRVPLAGSLAPAQERAHPAGAVPADSLVSFDLLLAMRNPTGAAAFTRRVSTPGSAAFHHYLTDAQWVSRYGPARAAVTKAESWLRRQGFTVGALVGDVFTDAATKQAYDDTFMLAAATGVSVLFCSHDYGDNFATFGLTAANYPASSPYVTAVGGTALEINAKNRAQADYGWSTAHQALCASKTTNCGSATKPVGSLAYDYGSAGGTSYYYTEPWYQDKVVPTALTLRNEAYNGPVPYRVVPDISMDADIQTGMLIGLTQDFPAGARYSQYKIGGTSLASPLFAGVLADADQAAGTSLGFVNPLLYQAYRQTRAAFADILAPQDPHSAAEIRVDYGDGINSAKGYDVTLETTNYEGPETYCDGTGNCATRKVALTTTKGFDSMTGLGTIGSGFLAAMSKY